MDRGPYIPATGTAWQTPRVKRPGPGEAILELAGPAAQREHTPRHNRPSGQPRRITCCGGEEDGLFRMRVPVSA